MESHEVSEGLWAYLCRDGYAGANTNILQYHHAHSHWTHEVSEVLWAYLCSVGYAGANTNIWH